MSTLSAPLLTCEPVITEACFLIQRFGGKPANLVRKVAEGVLVVGLDLAQDAASVETLLDRHHDTPMSLADACLVRLSERIPDSRVFTLDTDFEHYRRNGRQLIPLIAPAER